MSSALARRDEDEMPSLDLTEELLETLREDPGQELTTELLSRVVRPMLEMLRQMARENAGDPEKSLKVTIELKSQSSSGEYLSTNDVASKLRMSQQQVRRYCEEGKIKAEKTLGGTWRILASQFEGVAYLTPKIKHKRRDISSVAGAWEGREDIWHELQEKGEE